MKRRTRMGLLLAALTALLALGATTALAHGGGGFGGRGGSPTDLLPEAAKALGVSTDALKKAILDDANARIDAAVKAERLDADQAADLKDDLAAAPQRAVRLTTATGVARNLGTTKAKLDDAFRAARKADITARIDQALKDGRIDADRAKEMKDALATATLPGYAHGFGHRGMGGPGHRGMGGPGSGLGKGTKMPAGSLAPA